MSALPLGRYRELLDQLLQLNEQTAALQRELGAWVDTGAPGEILSQIKTNNVPSQSQSEDLESHRANVNDTVLNMESSSLSSSSNSNRAASLNGDSSSVGLNRDSNENVPSTSASTGEYCRTSEQCHKSNGVKTKIYTNPTNMQRSKNINSVKTCKTLVKSDMEQMDLIAGDDDFYETTRKPHFLDEDYHLKKNDMCRIPKPHFLDHSPSPSEEKNINIDDPHLLSDNTAEFESWKRKSKSGGGGGDSKQNGKSVNCKENPTTDESNVSEKSNPRYTIVNNTDVMTNSSNKFFSPLNDSGWPEKDLWHNQDSCSVKSFSSAGSGSAPLTGSLSQSQLGPKVDCVYSLLSLLTISAENNADMSDYLLKMSQTNESCIAMRQSGCIPLLVQLIHSKHPYVSREKAAQALHNLIYAQPDDKAGKREVRVLRLLEQVREFCHILDTVLSKKDQNLSYEDDMEKHPTQSVAALMKLSFDEEHRHVMCQLGGLQALATLVTVDQKAHGSLIDDIQCVTMRKYSGMALTNLTFGDGNNKALLCSFKDFMFALVDQLQSPNDDMRQVTAAVLRNLSWRADTASKQILREVGAVRGLTLAAMTGKKEATLKSVLSALWNLTAHCSSNKVEICSVDGALAFLVDMLSFDAPSKTLAIVENAGGILRNVSSHIAVREEYRQILRERNCLKVLLEQLKSPSLTIVSNSCGTLWNLSARCQQDQQYLWDHGAIPMLRSLIHSKHKMISMGSSAALKNLLNSKPGKNHIASLGSTSRDLNFSVLPTLGVRKQKALEHEIDQNLAETCENIEPATSPTTNNRDEKLLLSAAERHLAMNIEKRRMTSSSPLMNHLPSQISLNHSTYYNNYVSCANSMVQTGFTKGVSSKPVKHGNVNRSDSKDSVTSTHSDSVYERVSRNNKVPYPNQITKQIAEKNTGSCNSVHTLISKSDNDFIKRYSRNNVLIKYNRLHDISRIPNDISRNNYSESGYDMEHECCDQPIDYSQKYSEAKMSRDTLCENGENDFPQFQYLKEKKNVPEHSILKNIEINPHNDKSPAKINPPLPFGDYQETDLDQPTDYSLRYAEDQSEAGSNLSEAQMPSVHEDTIKHFCTEGTPYETPINFSTATSMSDLRAIGAATLVTDKTFVEVKEITKPAPTLVKKESIEVSHSDEKDVCSLEDAAKHDNDEVLINPELPEIPTTSSDVLKYDSKFSSGIISPDKPINYCEEGTPGYFSRVSSLSSLDEIDDTSKSGNKWSSEKEETLNGNYTPPNNETVVSVENEKEKDCKNTPLENNSIINYSEETPLMFSRCSSLGSLSECSVPDQPDDVGSIVSEFSRMTSGCISPSELPDSPTQSPLPKTEIANVPTVFNKPVKHFKMPSQPPNRLHSVFEDEVSTFKFEHTPIEFSTGTSLSSLTIDDEPTGKVSLNIFNNTTKRSEGVGCSNPIEIPVSKSGNSCSVSNENSLPENIDQSVKSNTNSEQESEYILAACIDAGVQSRIKNRSTNTSYRSNISTAKNTNDKSNKINLNHERDPEQILAACIDAGVQSRIKSRTSNVPGKSSNDLIIKSSNIQDSCLQSDTVHTYCTEDTPLLSKVGSHSDLSVLSISEQDNAENIMENDIVTIDKKDYSDDSSNLSGDNENLLAECINSGMPKNAIPSYLIPQDEVANYAVEGSPFQYSLHSSLSDLTVASDKTSSRARLFKCNSNAPVPLSSSSPQDNRYLDNEPYKALSHHSPSGSLSSVSLGSEDGHILDMAIRAGVPQDTNPQITYSKDALKEVSKSDQKSQSSSSNPSEEHVSNLTRNDSLSSTSVDSLGSNEGEQAILEQCIKSGMPKAQSTSRKWDENSKIFEKNHKSRNGPVGDTSKNHLVMVDNLILEEVINQGLPKRKTKVDKCSKPDSKYLHNSSSGNSGFRLRNTSDNFEDCSKNVKETSVVVVNGPNTTHQNANTVKITSDVKTAVTNENITGNKSRNIEIPDQSLQKSIIQISRVESEDFDRVQLPNGVISNDSLSNLIIKNGSKFDNSINESSSDSQGKINDSGENGFFTSNLANTLERSKNISCSVESSALCQSLKYDFTMVESVTEMCDSSNKADKPSSDTWNENTCPNDVSFSTISGSIPMISSFKSDVTEDVVGTTGLPDLLEESIVLCDDGNKPDLTNEIVDCLDGNVSTKSSLHKENPGSIVKDESETPLRDDSSKIIENKSDSTLYNADLSMTNSTLIENEAARLALMMKRNNESYCLTESAHSMFSLDLENVKPPSHMGSLISLTQSTSGYWDDSHSENMDKNNLIKKSIHNSQRKKSLTHGIMARRALTNSMTNHGSFEFWDMNGSNNLDCIKPPSEMDDVLDMENSMISVASIVSEVADVNNAVPGGINFELKQPVNNTFSVNCSIYNSIIENTNPPSLFDELTESTLEIEHHNENSYSTFTLNDVHSLKNSHFTIKDNLRCEDSSSDNLKGTLLNKMHLTPKQKRQLIKDRYKTYVIESDNSSKNEQSMESTSDDTYVNSNVSDNVSENETQTVVNNERKSRLNPKQRRQEDRARYQTQTVSSSDLFSEMSNKIANISLEPKIADVKKTMKQKRIENSERFRTRTLTESSSSEINSSSDVEKKVNPDLEGRMTPNANLNDYYQSQLARDASKVFEFLQKQSVDDTPADIDCETMSLISEDDSELNSLRLKTFTKSFRNYLPVIESPSSVDKCIEKNLKNLNVSSHIDDQICADIYHGSELNNDISLERDQNSGTESADQNVYSDSDGESQTKIKPVVVKPTLKKKIFVNSNSSLNSDENTPKGIRGRRKTPYVSPYRRNDPVSRKSPSKVITNAKSSKNMIGNGTSKTQNNIIGKNPFTMKKYSNSTTKTCNIAYGKASDKTKGCSPQRKKPQQSIDETPKTPVLVRQDTFTKEESTVLYMTKVEPKSPEKKKNFSSKLVKPTSIAQNFEIVESRIQSLSKIANKPPVGKLNELPNKSTYTKIGNTSSAKMSPSGLKNSVSNQSLQSNDSAKTVTLTPKVNNAPKYSSNSSINSASSSKASIKEVTSKVASLWKKVEQNRKVTAKDTRVWITNNAKDTVETNGKAATKTKLTRSSTFEGPPKTGSSIPVPPKQKSSIAIKMPQSPVHRYNSKVPVIKSTSKSSVSPIAKNSKC